MYKKARIKGKALLCAVAVCVLCCFEYLSILPGRFIQMQIILPLRRKEKRDLN
jgi:hypothetical protein